MGSVNVQVYFPPNLACNHFYTTLKSFQVADNLLAKLKELHKTIYNEEINIHNLSKQILLLKNPIQTRCCF